MKDFVIRINVASIDSDGTKHDEFHVVSSTLSGTFRGILQLINQIMECIDSNVSDVTSDEEV